MTKVCSISRTDLKAGRYKKAVKQSFGSEPAKRNVELLATLLKKISVQ